MMIIYTPALILLLFTVIKGPEIMLTVILASSNRPEMVNIRLVSGEERQINTFEVKFESDSLLCWMWWPLGTS